MFFVVKKVGENVNIPNQLTTTPQTVSQHSSSAAPSFFFINVFAVSKNQAVSVCNFSLVSAGLVCCFAPGPICCSSVKPLQNSPETFHKYFSAYWEVLLDTSLPLRSYPEKLFSEFWSCLSTKLLVYLFPGSFTPDLGYSCDIGLRPCFFLLSACPGVFCCILLVLVICLLWPFACLITTLPYGFVPCFVSVYYKLSPLQMKQRTTTW